MTQFEFHKFPLFQVIMENFKIGDIVEVKEKNVTGKVSYNN